MKNKVNYQVLNIILYLICAILLIFFLKEVQLLPKMKNIFIALIPFYVAYIISWMMYPLGEFFSNYLKIPTSFAFSLAIIINIFFVLTIVFILIPLILFQFTDLIKNAPNIIHSYQMNVKNILISFGINDSPIINILYQQFAGLFSIQGIKEYYDVLFGSVKIVGNYAIRGISGLTNIIIQMLIAYVMSFYLIKDSRIFSNKIITLTTKKHANKITEIVLEISKTIKSFLVGVLIESIIVSIVVSIGLAIIGIPAAFLFGVFCGLFNIIPYLGPIIGAIPVLIIALSISFKTFILAIIIVFGTQIIDANFIQPKIMSNATNLHPLTVLVSLIIFGQLFGIIGMILATPIGATINIMFKHSKYNVKL